MLAVNTALRQLFLGENPLGPGAALIAEALGVNTTLELVDLRRSGLGPEAAQSVADALCMNMTLMDLDLEFNALGPEGAGAIAESLVDNTTLLRLRLSGNAIGDEGAACIIDALAGNVGLLEFCLAHNGLARPAGVERFLIANITLRELDLSGNPLGDDAVRDLAAGLSANDTLTHVTLQGATFTDTGAVALSTALSDSKISLGLRENVHLTTVGMAALASWTGWDDGQELALEHRKGLERAAWRASVKLHEAKQEAMLDNLI
jgi:Ran GTPase-activating protein (RanGAP) involved in mRNA processing and transport